MNKFKMVFANLFVFGLLASSLAAQETKPTIQSLSFISGCWEINNPERNRLVSEQWMSPMGNAMLGMSRTLNNGKLGAYEHLRIVEDDKGIHYVAKPSENNEETSFKLIKFAASEVVFENPTHSFPQRIIYRLAKPDSLAARIEGTMNGKLTGMDFPMTRTKCG